MNRYEAIKNAYKDLGGEATFYDGMITCSTLPGKAVCKLVWNMNKRKNTRYLELALSGIPKDFGGKMLEVPVGKRGLKNVRFVQGDVGKLPFSDASFDLVLSLNGFHAFPDKEAAYREVFRVLKPGGIFCGCFYVKGENKRTDWFIEKIYTPKGYFTPPYETARSLEKRLKAMYRKAEVKTVEGMAAFRCRKGDSDGK